MLIRIPSPIWQFLRARTQLSRLDRIPVSSVLRLKSKNINQVCVLIQHESQSWAELLFRYHFDPSSSIEVMLGRAWDEPSRCSFWLQLKHTPNSNPSGAYQHMWHQYINNTASLVKIETAHCEIYKAAVLSYSHQIPPPRAQLQSHLISPLQLPLFIWILSARQLLQPASGLPEALVFCRILRKCIFNMMKNLQAWLYWFDQLGNCHNNSSIASKKRRDFTKRSCRQFREQPNNRPWGKKNLSRSSADGSLPLETIYEDFSLWLEARVSEILIAPLPMSYNQGLISQEVANKSPENQNWNCISGA